MYDVTTISNYFLAFGLSSIILACILDIIQSNKEYDKLIDEINEFEKVIIITDLFKEKNNMTGEPMRSFTIKYEVQIEVNSAGLEESSAKVKAFDLISSAIGEGTGESSISSINLLSCEKKSDG